MSNIFGKNPNQAPLNHNLGSLAYQDQDFVRIGTLALGNGTIGSNKLTINHDNNGDVLLIKNDVDDSSSIIRLQGQDATGNDKQAEFFFSPSGDYVGIAYRDTGSAVGPTEEAQLLVSANGNVGVGTSTPEDKLHVVGNTITSGIVFSTTQTANATTNTLDDYEEGTWTPVYTTTGTDYTSVTYQHNLGKYTKIGNTVIVSWSIEVTDLDATGATGNAIISGLPFAAGYTFSETVTGKSQFSLLSETTSDTSSTGVYVEGGASHLVLASGSPLVSTSAFPSATGVAKYVCVGELIYSTGN